MNNELRFCGVVHNVEKMETRTSNNGNVFYSQRFNLSCDVELRDGRKIKKYATMRLEGNNISRYAALVTNSYSHQTPVTAWIDVSKSTDDFFTTCNVFRMEEGDHTGRMEHAQVSQDGPITGIDALGPRQ